MTPDLTFHPEVKEGLAGGQAVVALESTLITHGFPAPENVEIALALEEIVRAEGAVPATIAVLAGRLTVGLTAAQIEQLAADSSARKCSRRDLPIVLGQKLTGATTVAGTMLVAHWAGINLFCTGGIGGVHRGDHFDESADLMELARTPVAVVCAGAKAILDLPLTLEVLESRGVPVLGYQTDELPAFYSRQSGLPVDERVETPAAAARIIHAARQLNLNNGLLVTVPPPVEAEWPAGEAQDIINLALADAAAVGVVGKAVTPYLLARVNELSDGRSQKANRALLLNNAQVAAQIALALEALNG